MSPRLGAPLAILLAGAACGGRPAGEPPGVGPCEALHVERLPEAASVVLVVNDTMRRDRLGAYGGPARTPSFDAFAREAVLFRRAVAPAPWTKPSIASLFTSLYPSQHGVASDPALRDERPGAEPGALLTDVLADDLVTLAEVLRGAGLRCAAFVANPWLREAHGFAQGFERYDDSFAAWDASGEELTRAALEWLEGLAPGEPFFLYLHYIDSHRPYGRVEPEALAALTAPEPGERPLLEKEARDLARRVLRRTDGEPLVGEDEPVRRRAIELAYDRGIESFDRALGGLLDALRGSEVWSRTAVIVTSDHGEALFERGYGNHGYGLFDDEAGVPLAVRLPGTTPASGVVECPVSLVDVLPSLCAYLGVAPPSSVVGWSFVRRSGSVSGEGRRLLVTEGTMASPAHRTVRDGRFKLLFEPAGRRDGASGSPWSLYDLVADPGEREELLGGGEPPGELEGVLRALREALPHAVPEFRGPAGKAVVADPEQVERLKGLGYLGE